MSQIVISQLTVGHIVNLASNDIHRFEQVSFVIVYNYVRYFNQAFVEIHAIWIVPIQIIVVTYLLYREVQWSAFIATGLIVMQLPIQFLLLYFMTKLR